MQIDLFDARAPHTLVSAEDKYDTALAYVAEGFSSHRPQHIRTAQRLLEEVGHCGQADLGQHKHTVLMCCMETIWDGAWLILGKIYLSTWVFGYVVQKHMACICCTSHVKELNAQLQVVLAQV